MIIPPISGRGPPQGIRCLKHRRDKVNNAEIRTGELPEGGASASYLSGALRIDGCLAEKQA
jgi:hypothetical protein